MIRRPNESFEARVTGFPAGLVGTVGVSLLDNLGAAALPRTTVGILEDPANSGSYVATLVAPATQGQYTIFWDYGVAPSTTASEELEVTFSAAPDVPILGGDQNYLPSVSQVAQHIMSRTKDKFGNLLKTFSVATTPNDTDVVNIVYTAATSVADEIGDQVPDVVIDDAANLVALKAAMMIELSFFSEQVATDRSPYDELLAEYERELPRVLAAIESAEYDNTLDNPPTANRPSYYFPPVGPITMDRRW